MKTTRVAMPRRALVMVALAALLPAMNAYADGQTANHNLYVNMQRARIIAAPEFANLVARPTPVRHMYSLNTAQGEFKGYINEAGTLLGDYKGFHVYSPAGEPPRKMTQAEAAALRHEIMDNLDVAKLTKVKYGDGGGRKLLLFSAIDCPACKGHEAVARTLTNLNTTFYIVPSTLRDNNPANAQAHENVKRLWCAEDSGQAWKTYWLKGTIPPARQCSKELSADESYTALRDLMGATGNRVTGVPTVLREDGQRIGQLSSVSEVMAAWGPATLPPPQPVVWLGAAAREPDFVAGQTAGQPRQIKVNPKDLLKKLFN